MTTNELFAEWQALRDRQLLRHGDVSPGRMMSSEALTHGGKVYAFHARRSGRVGLGCRLGRKYPVEDLGLTDWQHPAPFLTRPPLVDWIVAGAGDLEHWDRLADLALAVARKAKEQ